MAGETLKSMAICLKIVPWSQTSHIVSWLTPTGRVNTVVKGAVRPKSAFLGQYDLNYTCEIVYYARGWGELRALRECSPLTMRQELRQDLHSLVLSDRFRHLADILSPNGQECKAWYDLLSDALDSLCINLQKTYESRTNPCAFLLNYELETLKLLGQSPEITFQAGMFALRGERKLPLSLEIARCLAAPLEEKNIQILFDAARVIGVYYAFHVENAVSGRRQILQMISKLAQRTIKG